MDPLYTGNGATRGKGHLIRLMSNYFLLTSDPAGARGLSRQNQQFGQTPRLSCGAEGNLDDH